MKRVRTLVVPFFCWIGFMLAFKNAFQFVHIATDNAHFFYLPTLVDLGLWYGKCPLLTPLWYVRALMILTLVSPLLLWLVRHMKTIWLLMLFCAWGIGRSLAYKCPVAEDLTALGLIPLSGIFWFSLGMTLEEDLVDGSTFRFSPLLSLIIGLAFAVLRAYLCFTHYPLALIKFTSFIAIPFILYGVWCIIPEAKWPSWIVSCSFPIYLIHKFILMGVGHFVNFGSGLVVYFTSTVLVFLLSVAIANLMHHFMPSVSRVIFGGR